MTRTAAHTAAAALNLELFPEELHGDPRVRAAVEAFIEEYAWDAPADVRDRIRTGRIDGAEQEALLDFLEDYQA